jgi:hypothetical protein
MNPWFSNFLVSRIHLSRKSQVLEYRINWEIYIPYAGAAEMLWLIIGFVTRSTRRVSLVEQELPTLPEHLSSPPVCFVDRCFSFCTFSFGHCVVCSSIYGFWFPPLVYMIGIFKVLSNHKQNNDNYCTTICYSISLVVDVRILFSGH